jgi:diguanylate cyclase (GGDEF)-like protein
MLEHFAGEMQRIYPLVGMLELVERVPREGVAAFESRESRALGRPFKIRTFDYNLTRAWQPPADREAYYVVTLMEPAAKGMESMLGLDIQSSDEQRRALSESIRTGRSTVSRPFELASGSPGYVLIRPVDRNHSRFAKIVVRSNSLDSLPWLRDQGDLNIVIRDRDLAAGDARGVLYRKTNASTSVLDGYFLPTFSREMGTGDGEGDPYVIEVSKQMRWQDLDLPVLIGMVLIQFVVLMLLLRLAMEHANLDRERHEHELRLAYMASHDSLTGLPNRSLLTDRIEQALIRVGRESGQLALLFLDIDQFKAVNDTYGHDTGDRFLMATAETILDTVRAQDTVARLAGDEFVVLLEDVGSRLEVERVVKKIRGKLMSSACKGYRELGVGVSIGVAMYPENGTDANSLLRYADTHMYGEKRGSPLATALML